MQQWMGNLEQILMDLPDGRDENYAVWTFPDPGTEQFII